MSLTSLITGASTGIGKELAIIAADHGQNLVLVARNEQRLLALKESILTKNPNISVTVIAHDLSKPNQGVALAKLIEAQNIHIDHLINNAGVGVSGAFCDQNLEKVLSMIDLNIRSVVELTHALLPAMIKNNYGKVMNVGSLAGFMPGPYMAAYYASKAFVNSFTEALSNELRGTGVTCTLLAPGATESEFSKTANMEDSKLFQYSQMTSKEVAKIGYQAMMAGKTTQVAGFRNKMLLQTNRMFPRSTIRSVAGFLNKTVKNN